MGKPRLIILVRHAQSEGNKNRAIHQLVPDHRVKLTDEGWQQAEEAGRRLRHLLRPDDSLQIFTSPYRRTRETTEGLLKTLTEHRPDSPSPFSRQKIKVYEEPRLREQDFGNFQPSSAEMERMWQERADYGHFFYRIPNGESAADAYDRVSGFNESLWRQFGEEGFPSVLVLVTHGLMTRIFLMKWYHWSVEYFEDLRNINHCEFILMRQNQDTGKYALESQLRTWSELKRQRAAERAEQAEEANNNDNPSRRNTLSAFLKHPPPEQSPAIPAHNWKLKKDAQELNLPPSANASAPTNNIEDPPVDGTTDPLYPAHALPAYLTHRIPSGAATPHERPSDDEEGEDAAYFAGDSKADAYHESGDSSAATRPGRTLLGSALRRPPERQPTPEDVHRWVNESGMGRGGHADALGDEPAPDEVEAGRGAEDLDAEERGVRGSVY